MGILDKVTDAVKHATGAGTLDAETEFETLAKNVPSNQLAQGLSHAFNSNQTPPFDQMLSGLFAQSNPDQRAGLLNHIAGNIGTSNASQLASTAGLSNLAGLFTAGNITPQQAQQIAPNDLQVFAKNATKTNPSFVDLAANFYAQHPTLVKSIGAGALALLMAKITQNRK